jgi:proline iminopeptidase
MTRPPMARLDAPGHPVRPHRRSGVLDRGLHQVAWWESGAADGVPAIMCHGGPGGANAPAYRAFFDPDGWRLVQVDQRGAGASTPRGELRENTTAPLVQDMEAVRELLGIERWVVAGGSWGATLALAYAQAHPDRTAAVALVCTWLARADHLDDMLTLGRLVFPEVHADLVAGLPREVAASGPALLAWCAARLDDPDEAVARAAAERFFLFEATLEHHQQRLGGLDPSPALDYMRIYAHYLGNGCFLDPDQLLRDADRLADVPVTIVHGRYDLCTPAANAHQLATAVPGADLRIVDGAGHMPTEPALLAAFATALDDLLEHLREDRR